MSISNGYATLNQVKAAIGITDSVDDDMLELSIESASRLVDSICERRFFTAGTEVRYYAAQTRWICDIDDVAGTALTVRTSTGLDGTFDITWKASDLQLEPLNRRSTGLEFPINRLRAVQDYTFPIDPIQQAAVEVTAVFGFGTAVPTAVTQATLYLAARGFKRHDSPLGIAGFGEMGVVRVSRVDPDVQAMLAPYRRRPVGAA